MSIGRFCWFDLMTTDAPVAATFYSTLFGWEVRAHNPEYRMLFDADGRGLGGIMATDAGQPSAWLPYVTVDDIAAAVGVIRSNGGAVFMEHVVPGTGTFAIFADAQGAALGVIQLEREDDAYPREKGKPHISWSDLRTPDPDVALRFLQALFGWSHQPAGADHFLVGEEHAAAVFRAPKGEAAHWMIYVNTQDVDATATQVEALGGTVRVAPQEMPGVGRFAVFADPTGAGFAVMQSNPR